MTAPTPSPSSPLDSNPEVEARMLVAQAWCTKANAHKVMDPELANAVAEIFTPHIKRHRMLSSQIDDLANFIMREIPGEPSQGAVDAAIRLLRAYRAPTNQQGADPGQPAAGPQREIWMVEERGILDPHWWGASEQEAQDVINGRAPYAPNVNPRPIRLVETHPVPAAPAPAVDLEKKRLREAIDRISFCWNMGEIKKICAETLSDPLATYPGSASTGPTEGQS